MKRLKAFISALGLGANPSPSVPVSPALARCFALDLAWQRSAVSPEWPYRLQRDGEEWWLRINDFPEEPLYTLVVNGQPVGDFSDWPKRWQKPSSPC